jgi:hypothetical protein
MDLLRNSSYLTRSFSPYQGLICNSVVVRNIAGYVGSGVNGQIFIKLDIEGFLRTINRVVFYFYLYRLYLTGLYVLTYIYF